MSIFNFNKETTHVGFADEAYWNRGDFRAVACVSARLDDYHEIEKRLCGSRCDAGAIVSEIKWSGVRTRDRQRDADAALRTILELATERKLRLDVLVWDMRARDFLDQTFGIKQNRAMMHLQIMYRSLFSQVVSRWQSADTTITPHWTLAPDRHSGLDYDALQRDIHLGGHPQQRRLGHCQGCQVVAELLAPACRSTCWSGGLFLPQLGGLRNLAAKGKAAGTRFACPAVAQSLPSA